MNLFSPDLRNFIVLLQQYKVEFILVGGYAVNLYGYARSTGDMDIYIKKSITNGNRLIDAIADYGFNPAPLKTKNFEKEIIIFHLGEPPFQIDIMNRILGLEFDEVFSRVNYFEIDNLKVPVISLPDLKFTKSVMPRNKDLNDLDNLP